VDLVHLVQEPVEGFCEHGNELSVPFKAENYLTNERLLASHKRLDSMELVRFQEVLLEKQKSSIPIATSTWFLHHTHI
jgi:hypothetical protein